MEIEAKFRIAGQLDPTTLESIDITPYQLRFEALLDLRDEVLDTPGGDLAAAGYALRVRRDGSATYVTLKSSGSESGGIHRREEIEEAIAESEAAARVWPDAISDALGELRHLVVAPVISVQNRRGVWAVEREGVRVAELAHDEGEIIAGAGRERFHELEVELKGGGTEDDLAALSSKIAAALPVEPEARSKAERGRALLAGAPAPGPAPAEAPPLSAEPARWAFAAATSAVEALLLAEGVTAAATLAPVPPTLGLSAPEALEALAPVLTDQPDVPFAELPLVAGAARIVARNLERLVAAQDVAREGSDPEGVHDMRVATRRMRAAFQVLFENGHARKVSRKFYRRLSGLARSLGETRDADVLLAALTVYGEAQGASEMAGLAPLRAGLELQRARGRKLMFDILDSRDYQRLLTALRDWTTKAARAPAPRGAEPSLVRHFAGSVVWRRYEEVLAYENVLPSTTETLHELRIAMKRLRYTLEFFEEALSKETKAVLKQLAAAQDELGEMHDADVVIGLIDALARRRQGTAPLQSYRDYSRARLDAHVTAFYEQWEHIRGGGFVRQIARAFEG